MQQSSTITELSKALVLFQVKVDSIKKDAKNPFFKSTYASLSNILDAIKIPLTECGLTLSQFPEGEYGLTTRLLHESGEWMEASYTMRPVKDDPQGRGSCITYQRRYAIAAILSLNIDEDDDGNQATHPSGKMEAKDSNDKPWLNLKTKDFENASKKLYAGEITIKDIEKHYRLSNAVRQELIEFTPKLKS